VTQTLPDTAPPARFRPGLLVRVELLAAMFFAEKIFLNVFVDFEGAQRAQGLGEILRVAQHWGFRFLVAFAAAVALFTYVRGGPGLRATDASVRASPVQAGLMLTHVLLVAVLAPLTYLLYRHTASELSFAAVAALGLALGVAAALAAVLAMSPASLWLAAARALGATWLYAAISALLGTGTMLWAQSLWTATAALTFDLVRALLAAVLPTLAADPANLVLSTNHFAVQITEVCSGLEGAALMLAFSTAWLLCFRREYIFPRALLLIPVGIVAIFGLNILRIAILLLIGDAGFPGVAQYGFHSQAGWIAFIAVACGLVLVSRHSSWLNRAAVQPDASITMHNPTAAYLMPLLAILGAGAVSRALSSGFEFLYCLRVIGALLVLTIYRRKLAALDWRWSWRGPAAGVLVFAIWVLAAHYLLVSDAMPERLAAMGPSLRGLWITSRVAGAVLVVPIAEELAYRGYLMRRLVSSDFEHVSYASVGWPRLMLTSLVFGLAHGPLWLPGILAGLVFGLILVQRRHLGEAVTAHITANALIAAAVLGGNHWEFW
jgi:exosortase E/protease (VPEID-CTERM system)